MIWMSKLYTSYITRRASLPARREGSEGPSGAGGSKSWSSRKPTRKHLSLAKFLNCAQNSSTWTWLKSESSMSAFKATAEIFSTGLSTCSEMRSLSPSLKKSSNDFPAKPPTFGAVWRSMDESWPESLRANDCNFTQGELEVASGLPRKSIWYLCMGEWKQHKRKATSWAKWFKSYRKIVVSVVSTLPKKYTHQLRSSSRFWGRKAMIIRNHQTNRQRILGQFKILIQLNNRIVARGQQRGNCTQFHGPLLQIHLGMNRHWETIEGSPQPPIGSKRGELIIFPAGLGVFWLILNPAKNPTLRSTFSRIKFRTMRMQKNMSENTPTSHSVESAPPRCPEYGLNWWFLTVGDPQV